MTRGRSDGIPWWTAAIVFVGVAVAAGVMAFELLGQLETSRTLAHTEAASAWQVILGVGLPAAAVGATLAYVYFSSSRGRR